jgi:hypothetical protein
MKTVLTQSLNFLVDNVESLSKSKFSGVHDNGTNFRVHESSIIPGYLNTRDTSKVLGEIISTTKFNRKVEWDAQSLWITISTL